MENVFLAGFVLLPLMLLGALSRFFRRPVLRGKPVLRLLLGNGLVFALLCALGLLVGEIRYRFFYDTTDAGNMSKTSRRWFQRHWSVNQDGFRDDQAYELKVTPGKRRVTFLGDSFTAGHGVELEERFANRYRALRPDQEIHVLASYGLDTRQHLELLDRGLSLGYQLDWVVLCYCFNDHSDLIPEINSLFNKYYHAEPGFPFRHSYFLNTWYWRITLANDAFAQDYYRLIKVNYEGPVWEQQKQRLQELRDRVQGNGGKLAVVTFPWMNYGPDYQLLPVHQRLAALWKELEVAHLDLLPKFEPYPAREMIVNPYDPHPNARAHALAAEAIMEFLDQQSAGR